MQAPLARLPERLDECFLALGQAFARPAETAPLRAALGTLETLLGALRMQPGTLSPADALRLRTLTAQLRTGALAHRHAATRGLTALGLGPDAGGQRSTGLRERG